MNEGMVEKVYHDGGFFHVPTPHSGALTAAWEVARGDPDYSEYVLHWGIALCAPTDHWSRPKGRTIALGRARSLRVGLNHGHVMLMRLPMACEAEGEVIRAVLRQTSAAYPRWWEEFVAASGLEDRGAVARAEGVCLRQGWSAEREYHTPVEGGGRSRALVRALRVTVRGEQYRLCPIADRWMVERVGVGVLISDGRARDMEAEFNRMSKEGGARTKPRLE